MVCGIVCHPRVLRRILVWRRAVALRAGHVEDDLSGLGVHFFGDGGEGAEELVGDVGEDGGAAGRDFVKWLNWCSPFSLHKTARGPSVKKSELLRALQQEIRRHHFNYFIHEPPSIAQGGRGVVVEVLHRAPDF